MQFDTTTSSSWQFGHRGRVAVFIDGNNLFHAARFHNIDIDYNKLLRVLLGDGRLLMAADAPRSAELFASWGYEPVVVDISEFEKLEGCVTCLSVRLRTPPH